MKHHQLIKSLIEEIRTLRNQINEASEFNSSQYERMERRNQQLRDENDRIERQREYERQEQQSKEWQREDLQNKLDRQERMGNEWGANRIRKELRSL